MKKKLLLAFAMALALCALLAVGVSAVSIATEGDFTYLEENGTAIITGFSASAAGDVIIPAALGGNTVFAIQNNVFSNCDGITSVFVPATVTSIGKGVFSDCNKLTAITVDGDNPNYQSIDGVLFTKGGETLIAYPAGKADTVYAVPDGVTTVLASAFYNCDILTEIVLPTGVTSIGERAFSNCNSLASITIPEGVTSIGDSAFYNCYCLASVTLPESLTSIGDSAFYLCTALTSITLPESLTSIGASAFRGCSKLTSITIPEGVTSIREYMFTECKSLISITISDSVISIENRAFSDCSSLASITIPVGVSSIGDCAFQYCTSLTSAIIPASVRSFNRAFIACPKLTIYGYAGTTAESYAKNNGINFYALSGVSVTGVALDKESLTLTAGETGTLTATVLPADADNKAVAWTSSDETVAKVSGGTVTALTPGTATVTATTADGGYTDTCVVTVNAPAPVVPVVTLSTDAPSIDVQGSSFTYTVSLAGTYDGYCFNVTAPTGMTITNITPANSSINVDAMGDSYMVSVLGGLGKSDAEKEIIVTVTAEVAADAALGEMELALTNVGISNDAGDRITNVAYEYATLQITDQIPGDVNGDRIFDYFDVSKLYATFRGKAVLDPWIITDINRDGIFDYFDVPKLYAIFRGKAEFPA